MVAAQTWINYSDNEIFYKLCSTFLNVFLSFLRPITFVFLASFFYTWMSLNWQGKPRSIQLGSSDLMLKFYMKLVKGHSWHLSETNSPFCNMIARLKLHFHWNISRGISRFSLHDYSLPSNVYLANINRSVQRSGFIA